MTVQYRETGRKVHHPPSCGNCHGRGCPEVELVSIDGATHRQYLYAAMTCILDHEHGEHLSYMECVPDSVTLGED